MRARDEEDLALELFTADNSNQSRAQSSVDWEWFKKAHATRIEHYYAMASGVLAAGYEKRP